MSYWAREVGGWVLVVLGLVAFAQAYDMLLRKRLFEAGPMVFVGFIVFRGGIHLLKVAVAARAAGRLPEATAAGPGGRRLPRPVARPVGPTRPDAVLPGPKTAGGRRPATADRD
jgi:hypothetical protein